MSVLESLFGRRRVKLSLDDSANWNFGAESHAGKPVTQDTAMSLSAAWACVWRRARAVGAVGASVYQRGPDGERVAAHDHWLHRLVHESPNADQTPFEFWSGMQASQDLWGNAYAEKARISDRIVALNPLRSDRMTVRRDANGVRIFDYRDGKRTRTFAERDVLHLRGMTLGGDVGLSPVSYGRHSLGLAMAADETAGKTFANGLQLSGFIEMLQGVKLDKTQREQLIEIFDKFTGSSRAGKVMPLDGGMKFVPMNFTPEAAQLLESRAFNVEEVCRWFDTPPILIGHSSQGQTMWGTGVGEIVLGWITLGLDSLFVGHEQAVAKQLLPPAEQRQFYVEFNREALMRGDPKARGEFYSKLFSMAGITANQIADRENMPRFGGGDQRFINSTLVPIDQAGRVRTQPAPGDPI